MERSFTTDDLADFVTDNPLPWQKPKPKLSPGRVAQAMAELFAAGHLLFLPNPVESPLDGQKVKLALVEFVIQLSKKALQSQKNKCHNLLKPLIFQFWGAKPVTQ